jgi:hypothetical protein
VYAHATMRLAVLATVLYAASASAAPAQPSFAGGPHAFALFAGKPAQIRVAWNPVAGAVRYRATWQGVDREVATPALELNETTPGPRPLSVVAIDADGRAGPAATILLDVVPIAAIAPGATESAQAPAYAIGTRFSSPGASCALDTDAKVPEIQARVAGRTWLTCGAYTGPVIIAPVVVASEAEPLVRETATTIHVTVASVAPLGDRLDIEAVGEIDLGEAQRTAGGFDLTVTPRAKATSVGLRIVAGELPIGTIDLPLSNRIATPAVPPAPEHRWLAVDAGLLAGLFVPQSTGVAATNLGHPMTAGDAIATGGSIAAQLGIFPIPRAGLEAQLAIMPAGHASASGTAVIVAERLQLAIRAVEDGRYGLRVLVGADLLTQHGATDGGIHYGAAFTLGLARDLALRVEAMHLITSSRDASYASSLLAQVGVVMRFGRRDRW